jgi:hypothetical protein
MLRIIPVIHFRVQITSIYFFASDMPGGFVEADIYY